MLAAFGKVLAVGGIATLAYATTVVTTTVPAAAQFGKGYALDDDDAFDYRPARRGFDIEDDYDEPHVGPRIVKRHIVQPVVKKTVVHHVVQPVIERRIVYRPPIVRKVVVVHKSIVRRAHFVHPWHERRRCFLPERYLCG
jgi:hypothetical protein